MARILLADDDKGALDLVRRALETDGHTVTTAEDGTEAFACLERASFDVLVTDVQMPGLDGIALADKALTLAPGMRLVLMSGYADVLDRAKAIKATHMKLVSKPFSIEQMRKEIRDALAE